MLLAEKARKKLNIVTVEGGLLKSARTYHCLFKGDDREYMAGAIISLDPFQAPAMSVKRTGNVPIWNFDAGKLLP